MKRYLKFILLIFLLPIIIKAYEPTYCSKEDYKKEYAKVAKIMVKSIVVKSTHEYTDYTFTYANIPKSDINLSVEELKKRSYEVPPYTIKKVYGDKVEFVDYSFYRIYGNKTTKEKFSFVFELSPNSVCYPEKLKTIDLYLLYVNPYANKEKCKEYPDFKYCGKNTYVDLDEKDFEKQLDDYIKKKQINDSKDNKKDKNIFNIIYKYIKKYKNFIIISVSVIILIFIIIMIIKKYKIKKMYYILLFVLGTYFMFPSFIYAVPCTRRELQKQIREENQKWCECRQHLVDMSRGVTPGTPIEDNCAWRNCPGSKCDGLDLCFSGGGGRKVSMTTAPVTLDSMCQRGGGNDGGRGHGPGPGPGPVIPPVPKPPVYCCYYNGNNTSKADSKYRFYNGTESNCDTSGNRKNLDSYEVKDASECSNTTCNTYRDFDEQEEFCNQYADTMSDSKSAKRSCITGSGRLSCGYKVTVNEEDNPECTFNVSSYGGNLFSAKGTKKSTRALLYNATIYLKEECDYEENLEMRSSGSRFTFINTFTANRGRSCKYKIYNENNILRNQMATIFRTQRKMSCEDNKYCKAVLKFNDEKQDPKLQVNNVNYSTNYSLTVNMEGNRGFTNSYPFKNDEKSSTLSKLTPPKQLNETLEVFNKVSGAPKHNFERKKTLVTSSTFKMDDSMYDLPYNRINSGKKYPSYFSENGLFGVKSSIDVSRGGFLCSGLSLDNAGGGCSGGGSASGSGSNGYNDVSDFSHVEYNPYCEIVVHSKECDTSPYSNDYDLTAGYRAGLKINPHIKVVDYNISNNCLTYSSTKNQRKSTLINYGTYSRLVTIYGGVIDSNDKFYRCKTTIINDPQCPPPEKNPEDGGSGNGCTVSKSGNTYTVNAPGISDLNKDGIYVRKSTPFRKKDYEKPNSSEMFKPYRIFQRNIVSPDSDYLDYYNDNLVKLAEPGLRHPIYFMVCPNNDCTKPYLCNSFVDLEKKPKPKDASDCITYLNYSERQQPDAVRDYCNSNYSKEYGTDGTLEACLNKCYNPDYAASENQIYRRIKYSSPFPNNRQPGWNWFGRESIINKSQKDVSNPKNKPLWVISLKQSDSYNIKNSNHRTNAGYDVYSELPEISDSKIFQIYESDFLRIHIGNLVRHNDWKLRKR